MGIELGMSIFLIIQYILHFPSKIVNYCSGKLENIIEVRKIKEKEKQGKRRQKK